MIYDFAAALTNDLFPIAAAAAKKVIFDGIHHTTTRRIKTALLESRFSPHHFHISAL
jgi:hypothetical protein